MARYDPHMRRSRLLHVLSETFWVFVLGLVILFAFFVLMGALVARPGDRRDGRGADPRGALDRARDVGVAPPRRARSRRHPRPRAPRLLARERLVEAREQAVDGVAGRLVERACTMSSGSSGAS